MLRIWRKRRAWISGSSVGPSAPWFQDRLCECPSRFSSPFASLCLSSYETRSFRVKPSCAAMKFTEAHGLRPRLLNRSADAVSPREFWQLAFITLPVGADGVAVAVVPLRPARREAPDLVAARPAVPGLGDELELAQDRILAAGIEEASVLLEPVRLASEDGREVEAKAVDVHLLRPVAQAVHDELKHAGVAEVDGVPGAG